MTKEGLGYLSLLWHAYVAYCMYSWIVLKVSAGRMRRRRIPVFVLSAAAMTVGRYLLYYYVRGGMLGLYISTWIYDAILVPATVAVMLRYYWLTVRALGGKCHRTKSGSDWDVLISRRLTDGHIIPTESQTIPRRRRTSSTATSSTASSSTASSSSSSSSSSSKRRRKNRASERAAWPRTGRARDCWCRAAFLAIKPAGALACRQRKAATASSPARRARARAAR